MNIHVNRDLYEWFMGWISWDINNFSQKLSWRRIRFLTTEAAPPLHISHPYPFLFPLMAVVFWIEMHFFLMECTLLFPFTNAVRFLQAIGSRKQFGLRSRLCCDGPRTLPGDRCMDHGELLQWWMEWAIDFGAKARGYEFIPRIPMNNMGSRKFGATKTRVSQPSNSSVWYQSCGHCGVLVDPVFGLWLCHKRLPISGKHHLPVWRFKHPKLTHSQ